MSLKQYLRIVWARKWLVLAVFALVAAAGVAVTLLMPKQYTASSSLIVEVRIDPALGALAPALAQPSYLATQVEVLKSERVAARVVKMLGVERSASAVQQWREDTNAKIPLDRYFANLLQKGLGVEPSNGSNVLNIYFSSPDPIFAQAAANSFAQAYMDISVELRVAPARQSAAFLDEQTKVLRTNLEEAQDRLSKYQQEKGIVVSDERLDQETARYNALVTQLAMAQTEQVEASTRQRNTGTETSPDVLSSGAVQGLKAQLAASETKLSEMSAILGRNHPSRIQLEAQIKELRDQIAAETRRVSGGARTVNRGSEQKIAELQAMVAQQKQRLLSMRADRDQIAVYLRDVDTAQRAYDAVSSRVGQLTLESQNNQANTRLLSPAVEPLTPSRPKLLNGVLASLIAGLVAAIAAALALELLDRRVRDPEDLLAIAGVPVVGVLRPATSRRPVYRRLLAALPATGGPPMLGGPAGARA
jgi:chain length determinant protein EpsF